MTAIFENILTGISAVQRRSVKMLFHSKTHVAELYCSKVTVLKLLTIIGLRHGYFPVNLCKFKLLLWFLKFSRIFFRTFCITYHIQKPFILLSQRTGIHCTFHESILLLANIVVLFFMNTEIILILFRIFFILCMWKNCGGKLSALFEMKLNHEII